MNDIHYILDNIIKNSADPKLIEIAKQWDECSKTYIDELHKYICPTFFGSNWESEILAEQGDICLRFSFVSVVPINSNISAIFMI